VDDYLVEELDDDDEVSIGNPQGGKCAGFPDVSLNSEYCLAVDWVAEEEIFKGYPDGTFRPTSPINRVELLKIILEAQLGSVDTDVKVPGTLGFIDVQVGAWYMPYVNIAKVLGVFQGDAGKNTARPADTVNRVEALKMLFETLKTTGAYDLGSCSSNYPDVKAAAWYYKYVCEAKKYSLFSLVDGVNFGPGALSTRGEMAEVLFRLHKAGVI
jgi:hypothetical protein